MMKARPLCCGFVSALCVEREVAVDGSSWCLFFLKKEFHCSSETRGAGLPVLHAALAGCID